MQLTRDMLIRAAAAALSFAAIGSLSAKAADVIKIGAPLALTGPLASEGKKQDVVWKMWLDKVNAAGGINVGGKKMKVELVKYDYQSDGQRAAQSIKCTNRSTRRIETAGDVHCGIRERSRDAVW